MKITFVLPFAGLSGGIRVAAIYADRLRQRGHEVFVVSVAPESSSFKHKVKQWVKGKGWTSTDREPSHFDQVSVPHHIIPAGQTVTDADVPDADVVIATWWETAEWVNRLSPSKGAKAYFIQHHEVFDYTPKDRVEATYGMPLHKITISKWLVELMRDRYHDSNVSLILNSVDCEQFQAPPRSRQTPPTVGFLYSVVPWKGCDISFKAIELARQQFPDLRVITFGNDQPSESMPLPPNTQNIYQPAQSAIKDIYAACDVWLCGSRGEGFHLPPLEAMACRCPVVSTAVGGPIDIIQDDLNGYVVPLEDAEALADRLIKVLSRSAEQWQQMSDAAYATAVNYTWDDATALLEQALQQAIDRQQAGDWSTPAPLKSIA